MKSICPAGYTPGKSLCVKLRLGWFTNGDVNVNTNILNDINRFFTDEVPSVTSLKYLTKKSIHRLEYVTLRKDYLLLEVDRPKVNSDTLAIFNLVTKKWVKIKYDYIIEYRVELLEKMG